MHWPPSGGLSFACTYRYRHVPYGSEQYHDGILGLDDLQTLRRYKPMQVYGRTKLMNVLFTAELARRLAGTGVTVNALGPGFTATELGREAPAFSRWAMRAFGHPAEKGAETVVYLAVSPKVEGVTGGGISNIAVRLKFLHWPRIGRRRAASGISAPESAA